MTINQAEPERRVFERADMLVNRTQKNLRRLSSWIRHEGLTCYRIYNRDIPELPLVVDWYEGHLHVSVYPKPGEKMPRRELDVLLSGLAQSLDVPGAQIFLKERKPQDSNSQYTRVSRRSKMLEVREGDLKFIINLSDYVDTGLFLDHRRTRARIRDEAQGTRFLNLFCYTGSFSVYAAAGGALSTTSVDLSNTYISWAQKNMSINGLSQKQYEFVRSDVFRFLESRRHSKEKYDLVVVDPPTVSKSKGMARNMDLKRDHVVLLNDTLHICKPGARVYFSTNTRKFSLKEDALQCSGVEEITNDTVPKDFAQIRPHRCWCLYK